MNKKNRLILLLTPFTLYSLIFFLGPMMILLLFSFLEPGIYGWVEWNFYHHNYGRILGWADGVYEEFDIVYAKIFFRSLRLALITVFFTLLICYPAALWISNLSPKLRNFFIFLITLPFFASLVVRLFAWMIILKPSGILNQFLLYTMTQGPFMSICNYITLLLNEYKPDKRRNIDSIEGANFGEEIDGHDTKSIFQVLSKVPFKKNKPSCIIANTIKGKGVDFMENSMDWHYKTPKGNIFKEALNQLRSSNA